MFGALLGGPGLFAAVFAAATGIGRLAAEILTLPSPALGLSEVETGGLAAGFLVLLAAFGLVDGTLGVRAAGLGGGPREGGFVAGADFTGALGATFSADGSGLGVPFEAGSAFCVVEVVPEGWRFTAVFGCAGGLLFV